MLTHLPVPLCMHDHVCLHAQPAAHTTSACMHDLQHTPCLPACMTCSIHHKQQCLPASLCHLTSMIMPPCMHDLQCTPQTTMLTHLPVSPCKHNHARLHAQPAVHTTNNDNTQLPTCITSHAWSCLPACTTCLCMQPSVLQLACNCADHCHGRYIFHV